MQKHHWYLIAGAVLHVAAIVAAPALPLHGAGLALLTSGALDWLWSRKGAE